MNKLKIEPFKIIGIAVRTTNENGQAATDIGQLWGQFMSEEIMSKIPNKIEDTIYGIYTNYESDHTKPYDAILACKVSSLDKIPEGMVGKTIPGGTFCKFIAKGDLNKGIVYQTWLEIWETKLDRLYTADFEMYGANAQFPTSATVDIMIAIND